jgi:hypothetical protein
MCDLFVWSRHDIWPKPQHALAPVYEQLATKRLDRIAVERVLDKGQSRPSELQYMDVDGKASLKKD